MHEIVTVQIGNQSNYIGTHFWNAQESYFTYGGEEPAQVDHDIHFKAGIGADGSDTYTPRALIYDLKSNFGTLRQINSLYEISENDPQRVLAQGVGPWSALAPSLLQHQAPIPSHSYQIDLNAGVTQPPRPIIESIRYWSDFNRVFYHPRSLVQIRLNATTMCAQLGSLEDWSTGSEVFSSLQREDGETLFERDLRPLLEECDQLQGLQIITGVDDAWGGFAACLMDEIRDDMGKGVVWIWACEDARLKTHEKQARCTANTARSMQKLAAEASLYIPLTNMPTKAPPEYLKLNIDSAWHTAALQATILESITLPSRLRLGDASRATLSDLETVFLGEARRNVVEAELSVKKPSASHPVNGQSGVTVDGANTDTRMRNGFDPEAEDDLHVDPLDIGLGITGEATATNGAGYSPSLRQHTFATSQVQRGVWPAPWTSSSVTGYRDAAHFNRSLHKLSQLFPQPTSFPEIFNFGTDAEESLQGNAELAVHVALSATTGITNRLRSLANQVVRMPLISREEREDMYSDLKTLADEYVEGWDAGSDMSGSEED